MFLFFSPLHAAEDVGIREMVNRINLFNRYLPQEKSELPSNEDFRRTLYWNPYVRTNKEGYVDLRICNTGTCRQLIISAEAITPDGNIVKNR